MQLRIKLHPGGAAAAKAGGVWWILGLAGPVPQALGATTAVSITDGAADEDAGSATLAVSASRVSAITNSNFDSGSASERLRGLVRPARPTLLGHQAC